MSSRIRRIAHRACAAACLVALWVAAPAPARADEPDRARAATLFQQGVAALQAGDRLSALQAFRAAQRAAPASATLFNIAVLEHELGLPLEAHRDFTAYLDAAGPELPVEQKRAVARALEDLEQVLARMRVTTSPAGAEVRIDGVPTEGWVWITAGDHTLEARMAGRKPVVRPVHFEPGVSREIELTLPAADEPRAPGAAPRTPPPAPAPDAGQQQASGSSLRKPVAFVLGGVGLASIGVGSVFGVLAIDKGAQAEKLCDGNRCTPDGAEIASDGTDAANVANVTIGAGVIALGVATVLYLTATDAPPAASRAARPRLGWAPEIAPGRLGLSARGSW